jgi:N-acetylglutamate synthase-like GNAT family acetyltransferase
VNVVLRRGRPADAAALHALIASNVDAGHLLPRSPADLLAHAARFIVAWERGRIIGCAELAPLSDRVAEVRSLVVDQAVRGRGTGSRILQMLVEAAGARGFMTLCAFTHEPSLFVRLGFAVVPHARVPEKIARDCASCALFGRCGQYAVAFALPAAAARTAVPRRLRVPA